MTDDTLLGELLRRRFFCWECDICGFCGASYLETETGRYGYWIVHPDCVKTPGGNHQFVEGIYGDPYGAG